MSGFKISFHVFGFAYLVFMITTITATSIENVTDSPLTRMASIFAGSYDNDAQYLKDLANSAPTDDMHAHLNSRLVNATVDAIHVEGDFIFYIQQQEFSAFPNQGTEVYRQALYQLTLDTQNKSLIVLTIWMLEKDADRWLNPWDAPPGVNPFANFSKDDAIMTPSCRVYWEEFDASKKIFHSFMGEHCMFNGSDYGPVRISDENWLSPDYLTIHEKWFLPNGTEVFGLKTCYNETRIPTADPPLWPLQWHSEILITGTTETSELEVEVIDTGTFFYNWEEDKDGGTTAMLMANISTGEVTRDVNLYGEFYYINDTSGSCYKFKIPGVNGPATPTWLQQFDFNESQYLTKREGHDTQAAWETSGHWQFDAFGGGPQHLFNYWHVDNPDRTPSRIMGPSLTQPPFGHSFIEIDHYHKGFDDVPNIKQLFTVPTKCDGLLDAIELARAARTGNLDDLKKNLLGEKASNFSAQGSDTDPQWHHLQSLVDRIALAGWISPLTLVSERTETPGVVELEVELRNIIATGAPDRYSRMVKRNGFEAVANAKKVAKQKSVPYPLWPVQFSCNHTGNGITYDSFRASLTEKGVFYYDSTKNRSSTVYYDIHNGERLKQVFMNGWVYKINESTGICTGGKLPPGDGQGPVTVDFMKNFVREKDEYMLRNHTAATVDPASPSSGTGLGLGSVVYSKTSHWTMWAFAADPAAAFHAWVDISTGYPFQIMGPGPALPPYGHAYLGYENVKPGFEGIDVDSIFSLPKNCPHD